MGKLREKLKAAANPEPAKSLLDTQISTKPDAAELLENDNGQINLTDALDTGIIIDYKDSRGTKTKRRIRITRFSENRDGDLVIHAYCFERKAARNFLAVNVISAADPITGEIIDDAYDFLWQLQSQSLNQPQLAEKPRPIKKRKPGIRDHQKDYNHCYSGIKALVYLARCDGQYHEKEHEVITKYCLVRVKAAYSSRNFDEDFFANYARTQFPDYSAIKQAMKKIHESDQNTLIFWKHAQMLVEADGKIVVEEVLTWSELQDIFEQEQEKQAQLLREMWENN